MTKCSSRWIWTPTATDKRSQFKTAGRPLARENRIARLTQGLAAFGLDSSKIDNPKNAKTSITMPSTPSKDYKRLEREQKKREKRAAREAAREEKLRAKRESETESEDGSENEEE